MNTGAYLHSHRLHVPQAAIRTAPVVAAILAAGVGLAWLPLHLAAATLVVTVLVILVLRYPVLGLALLVPVIPFSPLLAVQVAGVNVGGMEALLALTLGAWLLKLMVRRQIGVPRDPLAIPWLLWLAAMLLSMTQALSLGAALPEAVKWLEMLVLYLLVLATVERRHLPWLLAAFVIAGAAQAALGIIQFVWRIGPEGFRIFDAGYLRAYGTFRQPNPYAGYLGLTLPLAFSLALWGIEALHQRSRIGRQVWLWIAALVSSGLMVAAAYASQSRGAWLGIAAAGVTVVVVRSRQAAAWFGGLAAVAAIVAALGATQLLPSSIAQRFADALPVTQVADIATAEVTDANFPLIERLAHWQAAAAMWRDYPWLGVGIGNYPAVYPAYAVGRWRDPLGHAHNIYLNTGAETGLVGLVAFGAFWLGAAWLAVRTVRRTHGLARAVVAGGLGVIVALSVHNTVDNLFVQGMYLHVAIVLGLVATLATPPEHPLRS